MKKLLSILNLFLIIGILALPIQAKVDNQDSLVNEGKRLVAQYKEDPSNNYVRFDLAVYYAYSGQIFDSIEIGQGISKKYLPRILSRSLAQLKSTPNDPQSHFRVACAYYFANEKLKTLEYLKTVLRLEPQQVWVMAYQGVVLGEVGRLDEGVEIFEKTVELKPDAAELRFLLGEGYRRQKKYMAAISEMVKANRLDKELVNKLISYTEQYPYGSKE